MQINKTIQQAGGALLIAGALMLKHSESRANLMKNEPFPQGISASATSWKSKTAPLLADNQLALLNMQKNRQQEAKNANVLPPIEGGLDSLKSAKGMLRRGQLDSAMKAVKAAIRADRHNPEAYFVRGQIYEQQGKFKKAARSYIKADYKANPHGASQYSEYAARSYLYKELFSNSKFISEEMLVAKPNDTNMLLIAGIANYVLSKPYAAIGHFKRAVELDPNDNFAKALLGMAYYDGYWSQGEKSGDFLKRAYDNLAALDSLNFGKPGMSLMNLTEGNLLNARAYVLQEMLGIECGKSTARVQMGGFRSTKAHVDKFLRRSGLDGSMKSELDTTMELRFELLRMCERYMDDSAGEALPVTVNGKKMVILAYDYSLQLVSEASIRLMAEYNSAIQKQGGFYWK